jgi:hypothetical protein
MISGKLHIERQNNIMKVEEMEMIMVEMIVVECPIV